MLPRSSQLFKAGSAEISDAVLKGVDAGRIALLGTSMGGEMAPRAAAFEPRLAACIANDGVYDFAAAFLAMIPAAEQESFVAQIKAPPGPSPLDATLIGMAKSSAVARWFFANGTWAFGVASPREFMRKVLDYNLRDSVAETIRCPTLVCDAEDDLYLGGQAGELFSHLTCKKTLLRFTKAEGADAHCQMGTGRLVFARMFDWLDETLAPA